MKSVFRGAALAASIFSLSLVPARADVMSDAIARIDQLVLKGLTQEGLKPNAEAGDEVFVRRVHLDLIGRIPTKAETLAFLTSADPDKRTALVDALVGSDGYVSHTYNAYADLLRTRTSISGNLQSVGAGLAYEKWLKDAIRQNRPYDEIVYDLVTASGRSWENPAIGYYLRDYGMPLDNLAITTQVFLGTQIVCAQCHNHPFDSWTQMDYYRLSAFTYGMAGTNSHPIQQQALALHQGEPTGGKGKVKGKGKSKAMRKENDTPEIMALRRAATEIVFPVRFNNVVKGDRDLRLPKDYQYDDASPLAVVEPMTLFGGAAVLTEGAHPIHAFGEWLTSRENPRFTKVIANRLWKRAFGVGLVEPVDDFKEHTAPSNPALMDYLAELLISLDYDLQAFQKVIHKTKAYQREAVLEEPVPGAPFYFAGPILRRMSAEQIWDSLVAMTVADPDLPDPSRAVFAEKKLAAVQLIAESIYDQKPAQFLRNMKAVVGIQEELALRIAEAEAKVARARENGDADLIKQATTEVKAIKNELDLRIEEVVYREGLQRKLARLEPSPAVEPATKAADDPDNHLVEDLASTILAADRSFDAGMSEILGAESEGIIEPLITALFQEKDAALRAELEARRDRERLEWKVRTKEDKTAYRNFDRGLRVRMRRASELTQPSPPGHFLREFGQSDRELVENANDQAAITQALALLNGPALASVTNKYSVLMRDMRGEKFEDRLETIYLTLLSRPPSEAEKTLFREAWAADPESGTITGIVWTVLNTRQFLFIQ